MVAVMMQISEHSAASLKTVFEVYFPGSNLGNNALVAKSTKY